MRQEVKERVRSKVNIEERIAAENIRRVLVATFASVIFFCAVWIYFITGSGEGQELTLEWVGFVGSIGLEAFFGILAFLLMRNRRYDKYAIAARIYWTVEAFLFAYPIFWCERQIVIMLQLLVMFLSLAIIPKLPDMDQIILAIIELALVISQLATGKLDYEHIFYALLIFGLCNIIARQSYIAYLRQVEDSTRISSAKNQAETDPMTGLLNRRGLERRIAYVWPMCMRQKLEVAVIMLDIDNFKKYNDTFGHAEGDECIKTVANVLKQLTKRKTDYAARVGGEEFLVFLSGINQTDALKWAEKCKLQVEEQQIKQADDNFLPFVSLSIGICHNCPGLTRKEFWELRNEADRSLYQAKESGRARVYMNNQSYFITVPDHHRKQYLKGKSFRSI